ncbi:MAG: hypothetical protein U1E65_24015 [Myxococcota bacterium]
MTTHVANARSMVERAGLGPLVVSIALVAPPVAAGIFFVWTHVGAVRLGYEMTKARDAHTQLLEENKALRIEAATLKDPARLMALAAERYKLAPPKNSQLVRVEGQKSVEHAPSTPEAVARATDEP